MHIKARELIVHILGNVEPDTPECVDHSLEPSEVHDHESINVDAGELLNGGLRAGDTARKVIGDRPGGKSRIEHSRVFVGLRAAGQSARGNVSDEVAGNRNNGDGLTISGDMRDHRRIRLDRGKFFSVAVARIILVVSRVHARNEQIDRLSFELVDWSDLLRGLLRIRRQMRNVEHGLLHLVREGVVDENACCHYEE